MKSGQDPRHLARILALQTLFNNIFQQTSNFPVKEIADIDKIQSYNEELFSQILEGVGKNTDEIQRIIVKASLDRPLNKINNLDMQILRIAIFEGFVGKITPPKVAIDEAIEIAKIFGGPSSNKFVSGVLGNLMKE